MLSTLVPRLVCKGDKGDPGPLTAEEIAHVGQQVRAYCRDRCSSAPLSVGGSMVHIRQAFSCFKALVLNGGRLEDNSEKETVDHDLIQNLRLQIQERDNEINILVSMLRKKEEEEKQTAIAVNRQLEPGPESGNGKGGTHNTVCGGEAPHSPEEDSGKRLLTCPGQDDPSSIGKPVVLEEDDLLNDRNKAFALFRKHYRNNDVIEENQAILRRKYEEARSLGECVNSARQKICSFRTQIERHRLGAAVRGDLDAQPKEEQLKLLLETEKVLHMVDAEWACNNLTLSVMAVQGEYKMGFARLRELKKEIDHLHMLLEQSKQRVQSDFESWLQMMLRRRKEERATETRNGISPVHDGNESAPESRMLAAPILTGNAEADADILAFYHAKEKLMKARCRQ
eukprot:scaffold40_cov413-Prasinococcus_capsulatus_cf.AAC.2